MISSPCPESLRWPQILAGLKHWADMAQYCWLREAGTLIHHRLDHLVQLGPIHSGAHFLFCKVLGTYKLRAK